MMLSDPVSTIMTRDPVTADEGQRLSDVRRAFSNLKIHHMPVVSGRRFIGIITSNDLLRVSWGDVNRQDLATIDRTLDATTIREVMNEDVVTLQHHEPIHEAVRKLTTGDYHCLPILDGETLVGLLTSTDLLGTIFSTSLVPSEDAIFA